ncbi:hypothetical protein MP228_003967 [Amoeboaphelidium protococcarum]|nr:hypothetical protein MP228_003967 [Amoeboaphelidium protococcarum]
MLPIEILCEIVEQLDLKSLMALSETTLRMHKLIKTDNLLWKRNLKRDFGLLMQRLFPRSSADCSEDYAASFHQYKLKYILLSGYHGQNQHLHPLSFDPFWLYVADAQSPRYGDISCAFHTKTLLFYNINQGHQSEIFNM